MHGLELLETLRAVPAGTPAAVILRHAARFPITDQAESHLAELTPQGIADAEAFGTRIQGFDCIRLFHSPIKRCQQTAEAILRGATKIGLSGEIAGPEDTLGAGYIFDLAEIGRLAVQHRDNFVRLWLSGEFPSHVLRSAVDLANIKLDYILERLREPCPRGRRLDLHVSHDWNILILRELFCAIRHEDVGWLDFLDGVVFAPQGDDQVQVTYRDRITTHALPWNVERQAS
jgi:Phosphohistidine phosphatase SixA